MNWKGKSAIITGGAGFIGSHLADVLVENGADVTIVDLMSKVGKANIEQLEGRANFMDVDVSDWQALERMDAGADYVFHLAAIAAPTHCEKYQDLAFKTNVQGMFNVLKFCVRKGVKKVLFPSSALLYGKNPKYLPIDEKHPIEVSNSVYNITKRIGETMLADFHERDGLPFVLFRLFNAFGPRQTTDYFIPTVIDQAMKTKQIEVWSEKPTRDFTYVLDTVDAFVKAASSDFVGGPINIGSGREVRTGDIAKQIAKSLGAEIKSLNKDVTGSMRLQCDNRKAGEVLGWKPRVPFEDGLEKTIAWFKANQRM